MTIPFEEHLNTNYAPTDKERQEILCMLSKPEAQLSRISNEIERLQEIIHNLKRQRDDLVQHIDQYRALTSPIGGSPKKSCKRYSFTAFLQTETRL